ncbi:hypothetical protein FH972_012539 [Carpinus fangiana]|uniref:AAA+ ATPase domain-containing protein n=1 Tax=Carpinus fangiana TaxID=176857 RepID=A0A5N6R7F8_9ROSI|nr:hypothetical protein FH972_012539 [Carpinus fangiana]
MAEIAVTYVLDKLVALIEVEVQLLKGVKEEIVWIADELSHIKPFLRLADEMEERSPELDVWVKQVRHVAYDIEDVLDECRLVFTHPLGYLGRTSQISGETTIVDTKIAPNTYHDRRQDALLLDEADLVGIEKPKKQLISWLVRDDSGREAVSVVGMGGLGKTTQVKKVYDDAQVKLHYKYRAWVSVSQSFKMEDVLKDMVQQLYKMKRKPVPQRMDSMSTDQPRSKIKNFLQQKRYLIVLDDVWHMDDWDAVKYTLPNNSCSRVMLTTRNSEVAFASCKEFNGNVYPLNPLTPQESWTLFCRKTFGVSSCPPYLNNFTVSTLRRCEGLPLAIVAISGVLGTKNRIDDWDLIQRSLADEIKENSESSNSLSFSLDFRLLNVLDLQGAPLEIFPNEITKLFHLKYLSLRGTKIEIIPSSVGNLQNLETFDLKHTCVTALPPEVSRLQKLHHLLVYRYEIHSYAHFNSKYGFKAMAPQIRHLRFLQKLGVIEVDDLDGDDMMKELGRLNQLRRLVIVKLRRENGAALCSSINSLTNLRALSITSIKENEIIDLESLSFPPPFLQRLYLTGCLPNLVHLEFLQVYEGEILQFKVQGFQRLKVLGLDKLGALTTVTVEMGAMPFLEKLILQRCKSFHRLPSGIEHLSKLKLLEFFDMPDVLIKTIRPDIKGGDYWKVAHVPEINSAYWRDGAWDVYSLDRPSEREGSAPTRSHELPPYWK